MRQEYKKPMARVEYFALSQTIADTCGANSADLGFAALNEKPACGWQIDDMIYWTNAQGSNCNQIVPANVDIGGICYQNPEGGVSVFNS